MEHKGFFALLFDLSFEEFVTTKIIKVLYVIGIIGAVVYALVFIGMGFSRSAIQGIVTLILSPLVFLLAVIIARVYMELIIVIFRIAESTVEIAHRGRSEAPPAA